MGIKMLLSSPRLSAFLPGHSHCVWPTLPAPVRMRSRQDIRHTLLCPPLCAHRLHRSHGRMTGTLITSQQRTAAQILDWRTPPAGRSDLYEPGRSPYFSSWLRLRSLTCVSLCPCCTATLQQLAVQWKYIQDCLSTDIVILTLLGGSAAFNLNGSILNHSVSWVFVITALCMTPLLIIILCNYLLWVCSLGCSYTSVGSACWELCAARELWGLLRRHILHSWCSTAPLWTAVKPEGRPHFTSQS